MATQKQGFSEHGMHVYRADYTKHSRVLRIVISALVTILLCASYVFADFRGLVPGPLTVLPAGSNSSRISGAMRESIPIAGPVNLNKPIDVNAANGLIEAFANASGVGADFSVAVSDASGTIVASRNPDTPREPASTMKTLTALAASSTLDMGSTFRTETSLEPSDQGAGEPAKLLLTSDGDMLLGAGQNDPDHVNGRAGLATLADKTVASLKKRGIEHIHLQYDDELFGTVRYPANIDSNNINHSNYTGIASMAVDGGRQWKGENHDIDQYTEYPELSMTPARDAALVFSALLSQRGVAVDGEVTSGRAHGKAERIATIGSATLAEVMAFTMRHSDNTLIEEFGRLTALKMRGENSPEGATKAVKQQLNKLGIDTANLHMRDCSGLSAGSTLTVRTLVELQARNLKIGPGTSAGEGLSIPGLVGTARTRLHDPGAAGLLRVKTGSLEHVTSMSGNVSRKGGGVLCFAVVVNNPQSYAEAKKAIDMFMSSLAGL